MKIFITGSTLSTIHLKSSVIDSNYMVAYLLDEQLRTVLFKEKTSSFILPTPEAGNVSWGLVVDVDHLPSFERELEITDLIAQQDIYWESGVVFDLLGEECEAKVLRPSRIISFNVKPESRHSSRILKAYDSLLEDVNDASIRWAIEGPSEIQSESPDKVNNFFVYGTLMRGQRNHNIFEGNVRTALMARSKGALYDLGSYPAMCLDSSESAIVHGELICLENVSQPYRSIFSRLDCLEGYSGPQACNLYERRLIEVELYDGHTRLAWTYVMKTQLMNHTSIIDSGCWREHQGQIETFVKKMVNEHIAGQECKVSDKLCFDGSIHVSPHESKPCTLEEYLSLGILGLRKVDGKGFGYAWGQSEREIAKASDRWYFNI